MGGLDIEGRLNSQDLLEDEEDLAAVDDEDLDLVDDIESDLSLLHDTEVLDLLDRQVSQKFGDLEQLGKFMKDKVIQKVDKLADKVLKKQSLKKKDKKIKSVQYTTECDDVWTEKCEKIPFEWCEDVDQEKCELIPKEECENVTKTKCTDKPKEECNDVKEQQCSTVPKQTCITVDEPICREVPETTCVEEEKCKKKPVKDCGLKEKESCIPYPKKKCTKVPNKVCEKVEVLRPREVCIPPPITTEIGDKK